MQFEFNLAQVLAHSQVYFTRAELSPKGIVDDAINGADKAPGFGDQMRGFIKNFPQFNQVISQGILPFQQAQLNAAQQISPVQAQLQSDIYGQFGPKLNEIGNQIAAQNAVAQAQRENAVISGPGRELVTNALDTAKIFDPEYFKLRELGTNKLTDALNNPLTGGEEAAIERGLNRMNFNNGTALPGGNLPTIRNAMTFGGAARDRMFQALSQLQTFLPNAKSGVDVFQVATGRASMPNAGESRLNNPNMNTGQDSLSAGQNVLGMIGQTQQAKAQNSRDTLDRVNETMSSLPSYS